MALAPATEAVYSKCVSECGNLLKEKLQEELQATRNLGPELVAGATTLALYLAANWNMALLMSFLANFVWRGILHLLVLLAAPTLPFVVNAYGVFTVLSLRKKLCRNGVTSYKLGWKSVGIMACCPIFIQLPPHTQPIQNVGVNDEDWDRTDSYLQKCCPLELPPRHPARVEGRLLPQARSIGLHSLLQRADLEASLSLSPLPAAAQDTNYPPSEAENAALEAPQHAKPKSEGTQGTNRPSEIEPERNPPVSDTNPPLAAAQGTARADHKQPGSSGEKKYLLIDATLYGTALAREVLLQLGFVPEYAQLRLLRSGSTFQIVVTALQARGYLMGVVFRTSQDLAVSPMELILAYLCLLVGVQLVMEFYVCTHFQRPLLLRLNPDQFSQFYDELSQQAASWKSQHHCTRVWVVICIVYNVLAVPFIAKDAFSKLADDCILCSVSTNPFFYLSLNLAGAVLFTIGSPKLQRSRWTFQQAALVLSIPAVVFSTGIALAVVATCLNWKASSFDTATNYRLVPNWLLPHVSSN